MAALTSSAKHGALLPWARSSANGALARFLGTALATVRAAILAGCACVSVTVHR